MSQKGEGMKHLDIVQQKVNFFLLHFIDISLILFFV